MRSTRLPSWIERLAGLDPLRVPPDVFALDRERLRFARFAHAAEGSTVVQLLVRELSPSTFHSGPLGGAMADSSSFERELAELLEPLTAEERSRLHRASLVIPDDWLRLVFAEIDELPTKNAARDEILRWKLKRLVPFRVEELRVRAIEVPALRRQSAPRRVMLGFAIEHLLAQLEEAFSTAGIDLGFITNSSLSLATALLRNGPSPPPALLLVQVRDDGYSLLLSRDGMPLLYRSKRLESELEGSVVEGLVSRELALTRNYLEDQLPEFDFGRVVLSVEPSRQPVWSDYLERGLGVVPELLDRRHLGLVSAEPAGLEPDWLELAPLLGASLEEVS